MSGGITIAFDTWSLSPRFRNSGTQVYATGLLQGLSAIAARYDVTLRAFVPAGNEHHVLPAGTSAAALPTRLLRHQRLWRLGLANLAAHKAGADLLFSPSCQAIPWGTIPTVTTILDTTIIKVRHDRAHLQAVVRGMLWCCAKFSTRILTISHSSKADIVRDCGVNPDRIGVAYPGYAKNLFNLLPPDPHALQQVREKFDIRGPYLFHHGLVHERKNLLRLLDAYAAVAKQRADSGLQLVLAGPPGWRFAEIAARAASLNRGASKVVITGPLPAAELAVLLKGATLCVIPSLNEGFCLPMVEAMACGTPTIAAHASCLPEVSGNVLRYFDPHSVEDMAAQIRNVLDSSGLRQELREKGSARAAHYSWEKCAAETMTLLLDAIHAAIPGRQRVAPPGAGLAAKPEGHSQQSRV